MRLTRLAIVSILGLASTPAFAEDESPPLSIYGFARLDILANDSRMSSLDQPAFVEREANNGEIDSAMTMTPRLSRIGISIDEWAVTDEIIKGDGKLEVDFAGGDGTNAIRLRHAYAAIRAKRIVELLVGQTTDLVSPMFPAAQNDTQLRYAGNLGDRRPQVRLSVFPYETKVALAIAAGAKGVLDQTDMDDDGQVDAMASAKPMVQWLLEGRMTGYKATIIRLGVSGHAASEELADGTQIGSSSVGAHFFAPFGPRAVLLGEGYVGKNLSEVGGGIGQGINPVTSKPIHSAGGWLELALFPTKRHMLALGGSADTVRPEDIEVGDRKRNTTVYSVLRYKPKPALQLGLEYLHWRTAYKDMSDGRANRFDMHFSVFF